jgi:CIC family chloride channel protein
MLKQAFERASGWLRKMAERNRTLLPIVFAETAPLDLRYVGRTLLHAAAVGIACGLVGAAFFGCLEVVQRFLLEDVAGYRILRAAGETFVARPAPQHDFRPWLLVLLPALGGLGCGLVTKLAPEARGGGGSTMIRAFHHMRGVIRPRVIAVKAAASILTLGSGGAGGREGPTMLIGGAIGSLVGRVLGVGTRQRRLLLVAGVAAGISAVFRTPLGAALLAVEVLYRDGFEADALVPSILASVVSYSVVISIFGESTLLAHAPRFNVRTAHLSLYILLALLTSALAIGFVSMMRIVKGTFARYRVPTWARPALGGLALGIFATPIILLIGFYLSSPGQGLGLLGGGYGAVQVAISGVSWMPKGWPAVNLLLLLAMAKVIAASLTIASGGSAGDFAPSLAIGGLFGGAFGRAAQLLTHDPSIDPGAFALVGMGVFYGGIAHVPLAALVMTCEMAGNYDLLVPLMLALGVSYVALRQRTLYEAQMPTQSDSPAHRDALVRDVLERIRVADVMTAGPPPVSFDPRTTTGDMLKRSAEGTFHDLVPVLETDGRIVGVVTASSLRVLSHEKDATHWALAADLMQSPVTVRPDEDLRVATERMVQNHVRALPVVDPAGHLLGLLDEAEVAKVYLRAAARAEEQGSREG